MDKIEQLFDATEHPDRYTQSEIDNLLSDPEVKDVFNLLDKTKSSLTTIHVPDVNEEWKNFDRIHSKSTTASRFKILNMFSRNIAASIAIGIVSFATVAAVLGVSVKYLSEKNISIESSKFESSISDITAKPDTINVIEDLPVVSPEIIIFDNETFETILLNIVRYYDYNLIFDTDKSKNLRLYFHWNQANTIEDVVENLNNFEQVHISVENNVLKVD